MSSHVGIFDNVMAEEYHSDLFCDTPTLSASIANILISQSPAHAWARHPKNPDRVDEKPEDRFELGTVAHALLLQDEDLIEVIDAPDWRTKDAKTARDEARATGRVPLLPDQAARVRAMVEAVRGQLAAHTATPPLFTDGKPEQTIVWDDDHGVTCRARLDFLHDDHRTIDDLKTTGASASPDKWTRTGYGIGIDVQVAMYVRGVEKLTGITPVFRYVVCETYPPYAVSVVDLAPSALELGRQKVQRAIDLWAVCVESGKWPAYDSRVASIEVPTWAEMAWLEREGMAA